MSSTFDRQAADIEAAQLALRTSIEAAKALASDADTLLNRRQPPPQPINSVPPAS